MKGPRRSVFLLAAEKQFLEMTSLFPKNYCSVYACDNIAYAAAEIEAGELKFICDSLEQNFFKKHFCIHNPTPYYAWWPRLPDGSWDHESRILALLLCAEMLRR